MSSSPILQLCYTQAVHPTLIEFSRILQLQDQFCIYIFFFQWILHLVNSAESYAANLDLTFFVDSPCLIPNVWTEKG